MGQGVGNRNCLLPPLPSRTFWVKVFRGLRLGLDFVKYGCCEGRIILR